MNYYFITIFIFSSSLSSYSQTIFGKYVGQEFGNRSYYYNEKGKTSKEKVEFTDKTLILNKDSSFSYEYFKPCGICNSQGGNSKECKGTYFLLDDTLYLTSQYQEIDFYEVKESFVPTQEKQLIKIVNIAPPYEEDESDNLNEILEAAKNDTDWLRGLVKVYILFEKGDYAHEIGVCEKNDTLYCKAKNVLKIVVEGIQGYRDVEISYVPKHYTSNYFEFKLKRSINNQNLWVFRKKLLFRNNEFVPIDGRYDDFKIDLKKYYHRQK